MKTFLIAGLGNPDKKYQFTRHNIGFRILENWLINLSTTEKNCPCKLILNAKHHAKFAKIKINNSNIILATPQTYMNKSGIAINSLVKYYNIPLDNILIIHDDLSFEIGKIKLSKKSGSAGHNGIKSIIEHLGNNNFARLRIGIAPSSKNTIPDKTLFRNFVLNNFNKDEEIILNNLLLETIEILNYFIKSNFNETANKFN